LRALFDTARHGDAKVFPAGLEPLTVAATSPEAAAAGSWKFCAAADEKRRSREHCRSDRQRRKRLPETSANVDTSRSGLDALEQTFRNIGAGFVSPGIIDMPDRTHARGRTLMARRPDGHALLLAATRPC
jgi:hypothetical protein